MSEINKVELKKQTEKEAWTDYVKAGDIALKEYHQVMFLAWTTCENTIKLAEERYMKMQKSILTEYKERLTRIKQESPHSEEGK